MRANLFGKAHIIGVGLRPSASAAAPYSHHADNEDHPPTNLLEAILALLRWLAQLLEWMAPG